MKTAAPHLVLGLLVCLIYKAGANSQIKDSFAEELFLKPLPTGHINSFFQFTTNWELRHNDSLNHIHLVARPIAEIFQQFDIAELHVSLTHGLWRYDKWGYPPVDAAMGAEIWAWFRGDNHLDDAHVDQQWSRLVGTLSGVLCASLSFIDKTNTLQPKFSYRPQFADGGSADGASNRFVRYATLPREIVCTENLTPWKKMLPCRNTNNGLASLLASGYIYGTNYHSLGLHMRSLCQTPGCSGTRQLEIKQTVNLVFDKKLISPNRDWSMRKMFGQGLAGSCYLADSSHVYLDVTDQNDDFVLTPKPDQIITSQRGGSLTKLADYDLKSLPQHGMFHIAAMYTDKHEPVAIFQTPPLFARRFLLGVGQERGLISTKITNQHWAALNVILQENIPWFVPMYLHTLQIRDDRSTKIIPKTALHFIPGVRRERPNHLELAFSIPARTTVTVSFRIDYIFLKWLEYPPDANHGHYIGAATITAQLPVARNYTSTPVDGFLFRDSFNASRAAGYVVQLRTESLLISLPTPDFSMPYNVICLACTVVALAFGPIHNMSTKRLCVAEDKTDTKAKKSLLARIKSLVLRTKE